MKTILNNTYLQLLTIYAIIIFLTTLGILNKFSLQFHIAAIIIAILGITTIKQNKLKINKKAHYIFLPLAILITLTLRVIPYINNKIPLGYDAGIYKAIIEVNLTNLPQWIFTGVTTEPGFIYLTQVLKQFFTTDTILTSILILFTIILALAIYITTKEYTNKSTAILAIVIYSVSLIQFKTFWYMYYKNIIALALLLFSFYAHKKNKTKLFIILATLTGAIHRPTFYLLGLTFLIYTILNKNKKQNIIKGIIILALTALFYLGRFSQEILIVFEPLIQGYTQPGQSPGTFIDFFTYQYSILPYLPLAILGLFYLIKNKQFNLITIYTMLSLAIVYFQFFFYNRFIIMLDIGLIILAAIGFSLLIQNKKRLGTIITILLLLSAGILATQEAINAKPLISEEELNTIQYLQNTEENAYVMSTTSIYSPYIIGYSNRKTIAPGLFDYNKHNQTQWATFWKTKNLKEIKKFLDEYNKPLYIFIGQQQPDNLKQFKSCFTTYYAQKNNKIYQYTC
ncbi:EpsG family protein [archaeon]|nr:EpsG family protein [archaeon]